MKQFAVYKTATGEILRTGMCADDNVLLQAQNEQQAVLESAADFRLDYVVDGAVVPLPLKPRDSFVFDYDTKQWFDPRTPETQWPIVRTERNRRLQACDWTQLSDIPAETKALWEPYRQALRDITDQPDPFNIVWPTPPTA